LFLAAIAKNSRHRLVMDSVCQRMAQADAKSFKEFMDKLENT
jgi:hypothetical protein